MTGVWMIDRRSFPAYLNLIIDALKGEARNEHEADPSEEEIKLPLQFATVSNNTLEISPWTTPEEAPNNSIAILRIHGLITYYNYYWAGIIGMATMANLVDRIAANTNIKALVLENRSGGGEGYAASKLVRSLNKLEIPKFGFVEDLSASASFKIHSACDYIVANTIQARIGSLGTYVTHVDFEKYYQSLGINVEDIYAKKSKLKNKGYREAVKGNYSEIQRDVDFWNDIFLQEIQDARGLEKEGEWSTGELFFAEKAQEINLIDSIGSMEELLIEIENQL